MGGDLIHLDKDRIVRNRLIYGRGFHDGVRAARNETEGNLVSKAARILDIENSLTGIARKVYMAIPEEGTVEAKDLIQALLKNGQKMDFRVLMGCLRKLIDEKLVRQQGDKYSRVVSRVKKPGKQAKRTMREEKPNSEPAPAPKEEGEPQPLERLAALASNLRDVADEIDEAILDAEEYLEQAHAETGKLAQLKQLLNSI